MGNRDFIAYRGYDSIERTGIVEQNLQILTRIMGLFQYDH